MFSLHMENRVLILRTKRLVLKPLGLGDVEAVQEHFPHPDIVRYLSLGVPWPYPEDGAYQFINNVVLPNQALGIAWHWSIRKLSNPDSLIGVISVCISDEENRGFWIARPWQGLGYATEASIAVNDFWFNVLNQDVLRVPKAIENTASRKISESSGMRVIKKELREFVSGWHETEIWEITRDEWQSRS